MPLEIEVVSAALEDAGFVVSALSRQGDDVGGLKPERSDVVEVTRAGKTAVVAVHVMHDAASAIDAAAALGAEGSPMRRYFATGPAIVVVEADDASLVGEIETLLQNAARSAT